VKGRSCGNDSEIVAIHVLGHLFYGWMDPSSFIHNALRDAKYKGPRTSPNLALNI